jgi:hypothetical protein
MLRKQLCLIVFFKLSPCCRYDILSSGYFPGVWILIKSRRFGILCRFHLHRWVGVNRQSVPKRRLLIFRRRGNTQKKVYHRCVLIWFSGKFSCIASLVPQYHWNGGNDFLSISKKSKHVNIFLFESYYLVLLTVCMARLLKATTRGVSAANLDSGSARGKFSQVRDGPGTYCRPHFHRCVRLPHYERIKGSGCGHVAVPRWHIHGDFKDVPCSCAEWRQLVHKNNQIMI